MSKTEAYKWYDVNDGKVPSPALGASSLPVLVTSRPGRYAVATYNYVAGEWFDLPKNFGEVTHYMFIDPAE